MLLKEVDRQRNMPQQQVVQGGGGAVESLNGKGLFRKESRADFIGEPIMGGLGGGSRGDRGVC